MKTKSLLILIVVVIASLVSCSGGDSNSGKEQSISNSTDPSSVYVCDSDGAVAYHNNENCSGLARCSHQVLNMTENEAENRGLRKCKICY